MLNLICVEVEARDNWYINTPSERFLKTRKSTLSSSAFISRAQTESL